MQRRLALAVALAFTTLVTFGVVVFGTQQGIFSDKKASAQDAAVEAPPDAPEPELAVAEPPAPAPVQVSLEPVVTTRYVYLDDLAPAAAAEPPPAAAASTPAASPTRTTTPTRTASPTALPSATTTKVPPTAAPSSTPAAAATPPPAAAQPKELEFIGTVTAIDGNIVTFSHGGTQSDVQVTNPSSLSTGTTAHVHAILKSGVYVATEIEAGG